MTSTPFHLEPIHTDQYIITGHVVIAEGVMIAPGVLLQADPGSRILVSSGVCLGMGCVIHANGGEIRVEAGVNIGAGVLIVGTVKIGPGSIIGAGSTIFEQSIDAGTIIPPSSLLANEQAVGAKLSTPAAAPDLTSVEAPSEAPAAADTATPADKQKVNLDGNGFFFSKGNTQDTGIDDPWASEPSTISQPAAPNAAADQHQNLNSTDFATTDVAHMPLQTEEPIVSTFVYPGDNTQPKHAWQTTADAVLHHPSAVDRAGPSVNQPPIAIAQPNPDSDLSAAEMQNGGSGEIPTNQVESAALVPPQPKQVYGQAYVNQMLGKMMGRQP